MTNNILGYTEDLLEVDGEFDYVSRSYTFSPIRETPRGMISTAAMMLCQDCSKVIKTMGGPGFRPVCLSCYDILKLRDFAEGHEHKINQ